MIWALPCVFLFAEVEDLLHRGHRLPDLLHSFVCFSEALTLRGLFFFYPAWLVQIRLFERPCRGFLPNEIWIMVLDLSRFHFARRQSNIILVNPHRRGFACSERRPQSLYNPTLGANYYLVYTN